MKKKGCLLILITAIILNITAYAAVISDNDGAAFVTKADFDALKFSFAKQIDDYNKSIDNKIDGAIAQYLAGIALASEQEVDNNMSMISYPLKFVNIDSECSQDVVNNLKSTFDTDKKVLWAPYVNCYVLYMLNRASAGWTVNSILTFDNSGIDSNLIHNFYNVIRSGSDKVKILGRFDNYKSIVNFFCIAQCTTEWSTNGHYPVYLFMDQTAVNNHNVKGDTIYNRPNRKSTASNLEYIDPQNVLKIPETYITSAIFVDHPEYKLTFSADGDDAYAKVRVPGATSIYYCNTLTNATIKKMQMNTVNTTYDEKNIINTVFTGFGGNSALIPTVYDKKLYYTNTVIFKRDLINENGAVSIASLAKNNTCYEGKVNQHTSFNNSTFQQLVSDGWNIESENTPYGTSHTWDQTALIHADRAFYEVEVTDGTIVDQNLIDGVYLTKIVNKASGGAYIKFDVSFTGMGDRYLLISDSPITEYNPSTITESKYYDLSASYDYSSPVKKFPLINGENTVYIKDIVKNSKIYYKIIYDKSITTGVTVNDEPKVTIYIE